MSLLTRLGLRDLVARPRREQATFYFLLAVSLFLFMDQNLMSPNLAAIGEDLIISRADVEKQLVATDPSFRGLLDGVAGDEARGREIAHKLVQIRKELLARTPALAKDAAKLDEAIAREAGQRLGEGDVALVTKVAEAVREREERVTVAFQKRVDDEIAGRASLWFWLLGGGVAIGVGYVTDKTSRKGLLFGTIVVGALPCLLTGFAQTASQFVALRALTGIGIGAVLPLTYSLIGDLFTARERPSAAAWIGLADGIGIAGGQLLAGMMGPVQGWRLPFILVAIPNLVIAVLFLFMADEPKRGSGEEALHAAVEAGAEYTERIHLSDLKKLFSNKTNLLLFFQGIPGSMPWGFFFTFLVDFYHSNKGYSVQDATLLVTVFGGGAILGGFVGGLLGGWLYKKKPAYLPALCGTSILLGIAPILVIVNWADAPGSPTQRAMEVLAGAAAAGSNILIPALLGIVGAFIATMTSSNVKAVLIDVNPPENRGTIFSLFNMADDLGKGLAPFLIGSVLAVHFGRVTSYNISILMWLICGVVWIALVKVFPKDVLALERQMAERAKQISAPAAQEPPRPAVAAGAR